MRKILETTAVGGQTYEDAFIDCTAPVPKPVPVFIDLSAVVAIEIREPSISAEGWQHDEHIEHYTRNGKWRRLAELDFRGFQYVIVGMDAEEVVARWREVHV